MISLALGSKLCLATAILLTTLSGILLAFADSSLEKLPISAEPTAMGINTETNTIYAALYNSHKVIVIDGKTNNVTSSISLPFHPYDIVVSPSTNKVYVAHHGDNSRQVSVIDGETNQLQTSLLKTEDSVHLAIDQNSNLIFAKQAHYFGLSTNTSVFVINGDTDEVVKTVTIEKSTGPIAFDQDKQLLYVLNYNGTNQVAVFDSDIEKMNTFLAGNSPVEIEISSDTNKIYVLNTGIAEEAFPAGFVSVVDGSTHQVIANVTTGLLPTSLAVNPTLNRIYVSEFQSESILIIDGNTDKIIKRISVNGHPESVFVNPVTNAVYVAGGDLDNLQVFYDSNEEAKDFASSELDGKMYTILGSSKTVDLESFVINPDESSILINIVGMGGLELELPASIIDGIYSVKIGDREIPFEKASATTNSTTIRISVPENAESVEIFGSRVVPEFPLALLVLFASMAVLGIRWNILKRIILPGYRP